MRIACIGGGPAGLYFAILRKASHPNDEIVVFERNPSGSTFGWGVVFSDETLSNFEEADAPTFKAITESFVHWDAIDIHFRQRCVRSTGHGFAGMSRKRLLSILEARCLELGIEIRFGAEAPTVDEVSAQFELVVAADGVNSRARALHADHFRPSIDPRLCKYIWLGTDKRFESFTFIFENTAQGMYQVHAYPFDATTSTFIVECDEASWRARGFDRMTEAEAIADLTGMFSKYLGSAKLFSNRSTWINFPTIKNERWSHGNVVLLGDAAHTAHFSIGSGTKLAMEDSIALAAAFERHSVPKDALEAYEAERRPLVERIQHAAQVSLEWFEHTKRYADQDPVEFAFNLMTRSKRITYENLKVRDPALVESVDRFFVDKAERERGASFARGRTPVPPMFVPLRVKDVELGNRIAVSSMCMYSAKDGHPDDFHLVHLGARAVGGAGLIMAEMTDVTAEGRISPGCTGLYDEAHVAPWRRIVEFVHGHSQAKIGIQLGHAGRKGATKVPWEGADEPLESGAWPLLSASPLPYLPHSQVPKAMDRNDMDRVRDAFVTGAERARRAGFDWLEVHAAHGYLLASFLSPVTNLRTDDYGGDASKRLRYPLEIVRAVREVWPRELPLSVRISATDWVLGGTSPEDALLFARAFKEAGVDVLNVSTGQTTKDERPIYGRMYQAPHSDMIRHGAGVRTIVAGNISSADQANTIVAAGRADICALARPHLDDPHFTFHAAKHYGVPDLPWPPPYRTVAVGRVPPRLPDDRR